jgi:hypothetical protein
MIGVIREKRQRLVILGKTKQRGYLWQPLNVLNSPCLAMASYADGILKLELTKKEISQPKAKKTLCEIGIIGSAKRSTSL